MNSIEAKRFIVKYLQENMREVRKRFKGIEDSGLAPLMETKNWKRIEKKRNGDGNIERKFVSAFSEGYRTCGLQVTITDRGDLGAVVKLRKYFDLE